MQKRNPPRHSVSWMHQIAHAKRQKTQEELGYLSAIVVKWIKASIIDYKRKHNIDYIYPPDLEIVFQGLYDEVNKMGYTLENFWYIQRQAIHRLYGDPTQMAQSTGHKSHALPYWNPTKHNINIAPMGIVKTVDDKKQAIMYETVGPGEYIMIPTSYTQGGKYSTLQGVAPQLKPLPRQEEDFLDLAPITYSEWCTFLNSPLSKCCRQHIVWYDKGNRIVCVRCGRRC